MSQEAAILKMLGLQNHPNISENNNDEILATIEAELNSDATYLDAIIERNQQYLKDRFTLPPKLVDNMVISILQTEEFLVEYMNQMNNLQNQLNALPESQKITDLSNLLSQNIQKLNEILSQNLEFMCQLSSEIHCDISDPSTCV